MDAVRLVGHKVSGGRAKGKALVIQSSVSFLGLVESETGVIIERGHELEGESISGRILVFPTGKGATANSFLLYELSCLNKGPGAMINIEADPVTVVGAIIGGIPMVDKLDRNPLEVIKTGDDVEVDADLGIVKVRHESVR